MKTQTEFDYFITPDGTEYLLQDFGLRAVTTFSGYGMSPLEYRTQRAPYQDGQTLVGYSLTPRIIQLGFRRQTSCRTSYWDMRNTLLNTFRPGRGVYGRSSVATGVLRKIFPNGSKRDLNVVLEDSLTFSEDSKSWDAWAVEDVLRLIAHDPVFYDPTAVTNVFVSTAASELTFPITFPIMFDTTGIDSSVNVTYTGTFHAYPVFTIQGPLNYPRLYNTTLSVEIRIMLAIAAGQTLTVDLRPTSRSVVDNLGTNYIGTITGDSDYADWYIAPAPEAPCGVNAIHVYGSDAAVATAISMSYNTRYIGI